MCTAPIDSRPPQCSIRSHVFLLGAIAACLASASVARSEESSLQLRLHLDATEVCPYDGLEATVEYVNTSKENIVIVMPRGDGSGSTCLEVALPGTPHTGQRTAEIRGDDKRMTLRPGEKVTSSTIWWSTRGAVAEVFPGMPWQVSAHYRCDKDTRFKGGPQPTPLDVRSEPCDLQVRWCDEEQPDRLKTILDAVKLGGGQHDGGFGDGEGPVANPDIDAARRMLDEVRRAGPPCMARLAWEEEILLYVDRHEEGRWLEACRAMWGLAERTCEKEKVVDYLERFSRTFDKPPTEAIEYVGDYESLLYGRLKDRWKGDKK